LAQKEKGTGTAPYQAKQATLGNFIGIWEGEDQQLKNCGFSALLGLKIAIFDREIANFDTISIRRHQISSKSDRKSFIFGTHFLIFQFLAINPVEFLKGYH